jgi:hypothetical protein
MTKVRPISWTLKSFDQDASKKLVELRNVSANHGFHHVNTLEGQPLN